MEDYILYYYNHPICWKYNNDYRQELIDGDSDEDEDELINIIILYKNNNKYWIDKGEYYEYGFSAGQFSFYSEGFKIVVHKQIQITEDSDAYFQFVKELNSCKYICNHTKLYINKNCKKILQNKDLSIFDTKLV